MKRRELKPGDIVRVDGYDELGFAWSCAKGKVDHVPNTSNNWVFVNIEGVFGGTKKIHVHRNQCTPIRIIKKKRRSGG